MKNQPGNADREIWCVYDFDINHNEYVTQVEDFNSSIKKAKANGLKVAWSNDCFELWFLLHHNYIDNCITRKEMYKILKDKWNLKSFGKEAKMLNFCKTLYDIHGGRISIMQNAAIKNSEKLHKSYGNDHDYASQCPCTTVYQLVRELNKYLKP